MLGDGWDGGRRFLWQFDFAIFAMYLLFAEAEKMANRKVISLQSSNAKLAIAILAVDNIKVSAFGLDLLKKREDGKISYDQARETVRLYALQLAHAAIA